MFYPINQDWFLWSQSARFMRYYSINKNDINNSNYWNRIIQDLHRSLSQFETLENKILVIKLQDVVSEDNTMIPKLEYKNL